MTQTSYTTLIKNIAKKSYTQNVYHVALFNSKEEYHLYQTALTKTHLVKKFFSLTKFKTTLIHSIFAACDFAQ